MYNNQDNNQNFNLRTNNLINVNAPTGRLEPTIDITLDDDDDEIYTPTAGPTNAGDSRDREKVLISICGKCGMEFMKRSQYDDHLENTHPELRTAKDLEITILSSSQAECLICGELVQHKSFRDLQTHHFLHLQHKPYKCTCHKYYFHNRSSAIAHLTYTKFEPIAKKIKVEKIKSETPSIVWMSGDCTVIDDDNDELDENNLLENSLLVDMGGVDMDARGSPNAFPRDCATFNPDYPETGVDYTCPECGENFNTEEAWKHHCIEAHDFKSLKGLDMMRIDSASVRCNVCGVIMKGKLDNYKMRRHKLTHSPFKAFNCRLCRYTRKRKDDVLLHIRQTHVSRF